MSRTKGNSGLRWHIPFHLLDGLFYAIEGRMTVDLERSRDAVKVLEDVKKVLESGISRNLIQTEPHTVLLSRSFYTRELKGLLCRWMLIFMSTRGLRGISDKDALEYLKNGPARSRPEIVQLIKGKVSDEHVKMMNLSHDWLETFLPFTLAKIDRVKYGLLSKNDLERLLAIDPRIPKNRKLLAVPFVGKDCPSLASEFSHPDVVIGLTILAYRYEGLRKTDYMKMMRTLKEDMEDEYGPFHERPSCKLYNSCIEKAGGRVRGTRLEERAQREKAYEEGKVAVKGDVIGSVLWDQNKISGMYDDLWPLQLIDLGDNEQMDLLYGLMQRLPHAILHYLDTYIFPECLQHQGLKLSACGQELGGDVLFGRRLGFSGTPSDLLPVELGRCHYEKGSDGKMLHFMTSLTLSVLHVPMMDGKSNLC